MTHQPRSKGECEARILEAKREFPLGQADRRAIVNEIRQLEALKGTHPELSIRIYHRINELLAVLDEDPFANENGCPNDD